MLKRLNIDLAGHLCFLILIVFSVVHFKERILNYDSAWYAFKMSNYGELMYGRPVAVISQLIPWILLKLGVSLKVFLISFSVSFSLIYYAFYWLISVKLKDSLGGIVLALTLLLCMRETFFNPVSEVFIGCAIGVLFFVFSKNRIDKPYYIWVSILIVIFSYFSHPTTVFLIGFSSIYLWIEGIENRKRLWIPLFFTIALFSFKLLFFNESGPESSEYSNAKNFIQYLPDFFTLQPTEQLFIHSGQQSTKYLIWTIIFFTSILSLILKKKWMQLLLMIFSIFLFLAVTNAVYHKGESGLVLEKSIIPLAFFVSIPFVYITMTYFKQCNWVLFILLSFMFFTKYRDIGITVKRYKTKNNHYINLSEYSKLNGNSKFMIDNDLRLKTSIRVPWAVPIESIMVSTLNGKTITLSVDNDCSDENDFHGPSFIGCVPITTLNSKYFKLKEESYIEADESILFQ